MQGPPLSSPQSWKELLAWLLASFITYSGVKWVWAYWNRKKPEADIHESRARTELALAQADGERFKTHKGYVELIEEMTRELGEIAAKLRQAEDNLNYKDERIRALEEHIELIKAGAVADRNESAG